MTFKPLVLAALFCTVILHCCQPVNLSVSLMDVTNKQCGQLFALDCITHTSANTAALLLNKTVYFFYTIRQPFVANQ